MIERMIITASWNPVAADPKRMNLADRHQCAVAIDADARFLLPPDGRLPENRRMPSERPSVRGFS